MTRIERAIFVLFFLSQFSWAQFTRGAREIAITIDDLPYADGGCDAAVVNANSTRLLEPIRTQKVPVTAFVIGSRCQNLSEQGRKSVFEPWLQAGVEVGNHTWSHPDRNAVSLEDYEAEILRTDSELRRLLKPAKLRYFRAPYLHNGTDPATRRRLTSFLRLHRYREAPVTLDNNDWTFASAYSHALRAGEPTQVQAIEDTYIEYMRLNVAFFENRSVQLFGREVPQVLLLHASRLNARMMPALLAMYRARGYRFVSLQRAMNDPVYRTPDGYTGAKGLSWIHRWGLSKGFAMELEPNEPAWIDDLANAR